MRGVLGSRPKRPRSRLSRAGAKRGQGRDSRSAHPTRGAAVPPSCENSPGKLRSSARTASRSERFEANRRRRLLGRDRAFAATTLRAASRARGQRPLPVCPSPADWERSFIRSFIEKFRPPFQRWRGRGAEPPPPRARGGMLSPVKRFFRVNCRGAARGGFLQVKKPPAQRMLNRFPGALPLEMYFSFFFVHPERNLPYPLPLTAHLLKR